MKDKLKCLIVDDELFARKGIMEYIEEVDYLAFGGEAENPYEAIQFMRENPIDLLFLDINMPKMNGIDFLKIANNLPATILTTAYQEYAIDGYELDIVDYLLKPISFERFLKASKKAKDYIASQNNNKNRSHDYFFVKSNGIYEQVIFKEILAIEALQNYIVIHTVKGKILAYLTMKLIESHLPEKDFIRIHKSFIVCKNAIESITGDSVIIKDKSYPIGNSHKAAFFEEFLNYKLIKR